MSRILAADDNKMVRLFYESVLTYLGQEHEICKNGLEALESFKREPAELVILDFDMPIMNGFDCCKAIRNLPEGVLVPIVIVSSHDDEEHISKGLDAGASDYLVKPVKEAHLIAKLKNCLKVSAFRKGECDLIKEHSLIGGRYRVERMLGSGSHSTVFLVSDIQAGEKHFALKMLKESASCEEISKPFFEIAGKVKELQSEEVVKILDIGQSGGRLYVVMEYLDGGDLSGILRRRKKINEAESAKMACDIAKGLNAFHAAGIIHLDIKPENILRDSVTGKFKLADFGLVTIRSTATMPLNAEIWSTLAYVPPEYFSENAEIGLESDIYSLGVTLYQCMTGDNPFLCERPAITMFRHMNFVPPLLDTCDRTLSSRMSSLVSSMMDKRMEARPTALDVAGRLEDIIATPEPIGSKISRPDASPEKAKEVSGTYALGKTDAKIRKIQKERGKVAHIEKIKVLSFAFLLSILVVLGCGIAGYYINVSFFEQHSAPGALVSVDCVKCGNMDNRRIDDITKSHCAKCGGQLGYAMKCSSCNKVFPLLPEKLDMIEDKAKAIAKIEKAHRCPACSSDKTAPIPFKFGQSVVLKQPRP
ncbi:MAG: hypothetical protein A2X49_11060 [Lentisphaerae bacterium GWF2_52_8]|nr:MAG: hypothetical protein A2X49_11060 [Lentisphaerae bacterium GWF2_52_8]